MDTKEQILQKAMTLFAEQGYAGVSMRGLAKSVGIAVSGVYHHFPDKQTLYLQSVQCAFSSKAEAFSEIWQSNENAEQKLRMFVQRLVQFMIADKEFHKLMQRELLEADPERIQLLAEGVFKQQFTGLLTVVTELAPENQKGHMIAVSVIGLVCHYLEMQPLRCFLPGYQAEFEQPDKIAEHVSGLLLGGIQNA